jgi:polygalacturonase
MADETVRNGLDDGASGCGTHDDADAFLRALAELRAFPRAGVLHLPPGVYPITNRVVTDETVTITAENRGS